mmetsp:Transcript_12043/g.20318  ORF Transcript_12043/g.20318 Transcript_12043/m.20318 type:complete len:108 (+) Transcript_12043:1786-2109(+)
MPRIRRKKERSLREVIQKVSLWRKLIYGKVYFDFKTQQFFKVNCLTKNGGMTHSDAAMVIRLSKKSLDDYLMHLRFGRKYGFDFIKHRNKKIGKLRTFVTQKKQELK